MTVFKLVVGLFLARGGATLFCAPQGASLRGALHEAAGKGLADTVIELRATERSDIFKSSVDATGAFAFRDLPPGTYVVSVGWKKQRMTAGEPVLVRQAEEVTVDLELSSEGRLVLRRSSASEASAAPGGPHSTQATGPRGSGGSGFRAKKSPACP